MKLAKLREPADSAELASQVFEILIPVRIDAPTWFAYSDHRAQRNIQEVSDFFGARIGMTHTTAAELTVWLDSVSLLEPLLAQNAEGFCR